LQALVQYGLNPTLCEPGLIQVRGSGDVTEIPGFAQGHFSIQDRAAYQVVNLMQPHGAGIFLDYCAAPGGKTTHLAEFTRDRASVYATDRDEKRLHRVKENAERLRLRSVTTLPWEAAADQAPYDAVLLDVPCSNTGVLAKRVEVRYRLSPEGCVHLQATQLELLCRAADLITEKGFICYSTCSIQPDENDRLIQRFLKEDRRFQLARESLMLPSAGEPDQDGGYVAILGFV
jgi:16S rRNA (cytosine967-C5)-methyltransferase